MNDAVAAPTADQKATILEIAGKHAGAFGTIEPVSQKTVAEMLGVSLQIAGGLIQQTLLTEGFRLIEVAGTEIYQVADVDPAVAEWVTHLLQRMHRDKGRTITVLADEVGKNTSEVAMALHDLELSKVVSSHEHKWLLDRPTVIRIWQENNEFFGQEVFISKGAVQTHSDPVSLWATAKDGAFTQPTPEPQDVEAAAAQAPTPSLLPVAKPKLSVLIPEKPLPEPIQASDETTEVSKEEGIDTLPSAYVGWCQQMSGSRQKLMAAASSPYVYPDPRFTTGYRRFERPRPEVARQGR